MTKEELEKEAEEWLRKYLLCCNCEKKCNCIDSNSYCEEQVLKSYLAGAEPREKRIAELKKENAELKEDNSEWEKASDKWKSVYELTNNQLTKAKEIINDLVHLGEFNEHTDEEYLNYQVHEALKNAEQFLNNEVEKVK